MGNNSEGYTAEDCNAVRSIYTCVLYRSNYGKSCAGKTYEELVAMKSFFDVCFQYETDSRRCRKASLTSVDALSLKLINSSKEMIISGAESCCGIQHTSNAWALVVAKDERDVQHSTLDGDREGWAVGLGLQNLCVVHVDDGLAATASGTSRSCSGATSRAIPAKGTY